MQAGGLLLVGCGKMGSAMLAGWMAAGSAPAPVFVVEPRNCWPRKKIWPQLRI